MARFVAFISLAVFFLLLCISCDHQSEQLPGEISLSGRITDAETGAPIKNVIVTSQQTGQQMLTDSSGLYSFDSLDPTRISLVFYRFGYGKLERNIYRVHGEPVPENHLGRIWTQDYTFTKIRSDGPTGDSAYNSGYERGRTVAEAQLYNHEACLYDNHHLTSDIGKITGLPIRSCAAHIFSSDLNGFIQGHNDRILQYIAEHGLPPVDRLSQYRQYDYLNYLVYENMRGRGDHWLWFAGPPALSPDSQLSLQLVAPFAGSASYYLVIKRPDTVFYSEMSSPELDTAFVCWPPSEDSVVVLRTGQSAYRLVDLVTGKSYLYSRPKR